MAGPLRIELPGALSYATARGACPIRDLFLEENDLKLHFATVSRIIINERDKLKNKS